MIQLLQISFTELESELDKLNSSQDNNIIKGITKFWCGHYIDKSKKVIPDGATCCFNHYVSLPVRWGVRHPLYTWQEDMLNDLENRHLKYFFLLKPSKIGATELFLRWAVYQAITNPKWKNGQVAVVAFTGMTEAKNMIDRAKEILKRDGNYTFPITKSNNANEFYLNSVKFRAFPALNNHINAIRSQPNMRMIIYDEAAFPTDVDQNKMRDSAEHYIAGSEAIVAVITTAGDTPSGFAYDIYNESNSIYKKHILDYHAGLEVHPESLTSLYKKELIDEARNLISFQKNYLHQWGYGSGDIFDSNTISLISSTMYTLYGDVSKMDNALILDPAYGKVRTKTSSKYAILGMVKQNGIVYTNSLTELESPSDEEALAEVRRIIKKYKYNNLIVDGHWTGIISTFADEINTKGYHFGEIGLDMTDNASMMTSNMEIRIHPTHESLIQQLRAIIRNDRGMPDKTKVRFDAGDCFLMGTWKFKKEFRREVEYDDDEKYGKGAIGDFA